MERASGSRLNIQINRGDAIDPRFEWLLAERLILRKLAKFRFRFCTRIDARGPKILSQRCVPSFSVLRVSNGGERSPITDTFSDCVRSRSRVD